uniref:Polynucleotide adenylyltransferase n=1 Tax=Opuntia streptacantha TaxID=393608 RepID=A0A7C9AQG6_OPUST
MAIAIFELSVSCRPTFIIRSVFCSSQKVPPFLPRPSSTAPSQPFQIRQNLSPTPLRIRWSCAAAIENLDEGELIIKPAESQSPVREWKKVSSRELGISTSAISGHTRTVLKELKRNGYEVYLVGGCVRDLILKRVPKDFDILTTAELREIVDIFPHSEIVGRRFPICHVRFGDNIVEVSSFNSRRQTCSRNLIPFVRPIDCDEKDNIRWRNCLQRDFTINGLMFDPFARLVYDYMGGLEDIRKAKVRTIIPSSMSFHEDCARILRAIRIAARLGFRLARRTAQSVRDLSCSILRLDRARLLMEMNYMLAYGSAEASVRLLWKFGLLEILLPHQAAYLVCSGFQRTDKGTNMLLALFANLDKLLAPDKPCHSSLCEQWWRCFRSS